MKNIVINTNDVVRRKKFGSATTAGEIVKYLGIRLHMALEPIRGGTEMYFAASAIEDTVLQGKNFATIHGMSYQRFKNLSNNYQMSYRQCSQTKSQRIGYKW
jgi:hypothetical protein